MSMPHGLKFFLAAGLLIIAMGPSSAVARGGWVKNAVQPDDVDQDLIQCKYEAESSTAAIGTNTRFRSTGDAVSQGVADGIVKAMKQHDLIKSCMRAKGYSHPEYGRSTAQN